MNPQPPHQPYSQAPNPYAAPGTRQAMDYGAPYGMQQQAPLAGLGARLAGAVVDYLLYFAALAAPAFAGGFFAPTASNVFRGLTIAVPFAIVWFLQMYLISTKGQSVGKMLLRTKIIKMDGSEVGFVYGVLGRSWAMAFLTNVPIAGPVLALVDILMIFGHERRCLHDKIAGTQVIEVR